MPIIKTLKNGQWTPVNSVTSLGTATPSTAGLMSASDKEKLNNVTEYSTDEVVVGTWVDGKPIYRKCFTVTSPSALNTSTNVVDITDLHIDNMISDYFSIVSVGHNISSSTNNSNAIMFVRLNFNDTGDWLTMLVSNSGYLSSPTIIVIEYTKTTD